MTRQEIKARFNSGTASYYSKTPPKWFPECGYIFNLMLACLKSILPPAPQILDLGAGTGNLTKVVLKGFPDCKITLMDFSENMLDEAEKALAKFRNRISIQVADFFKAELGRGRYHAVISSFAIHHARGPAVYQGLYKKIHGALKRNGVFICADVVEGETGPISLINEEGWKKHMTRYYPPEAVETTMTNYRREDSPISLRKHMQLLARAGFSACDILWKKHNFSVFLGIK